MVATYYFFAIIYVTLLIMKKKDFVALYINPISPIACYCNVGLSA